MEQPTADPTLAKGAPVSLPETGSDRDKGTNPISGRALCLSGGGYRAMLFHLGTLWRLNDWGLLKDIKRISSVSGGSITAGMLGLKWSRLEFDSVTGVARNFETEVVTPIRDLAGHSLDIKATIGGILLPGGSAARVAKAYDKHLFHGATLQDLPGKDEGPFFVINATNVQSGALWIHTRLHG